MYDNNGDIFGFTFDGTEYYYIKNAQNDVIAIADASGTVIANYYYDAWGKIIDITGNQTIANLNPIRYRSYYYDSECNFYYLNSRYYSVDLCRFLNADGLVQTGQGVLDKNMFAYCGNNPVNYADSNGNIAFSTIIFGVVGLVVVAAVIGYILVKKSLSTPIDDVCTACDIVRDHEKIKQDTQEAMYNYTKDSMKIGSGEKNYKPSPPRNFYNVGNGQKRNQMSTEEYIEQCKKNYNNMLMFCPDTIKRGDTWDDLVRTGKDQELCRQMVAWDESAYRDFMYDHTAKQTHKGIEEAYFPFELTK